MHRILNEQSEGERRSCWCLQRNPIAISFERNFKLYLFCGRGQGFRFKLPVSNLLSQNDEELLASLENVWIPQIGMFLQMLHPFLQKFASPYRKIPRQRASPIDPKPEKKRGPYLPTVSESPTTQRCLFGLVIATAAIYDNDQPCLPLRKYHDKPFNLLLSPKNPTSPFSLLLTRLTTTASFSLP